MFKYDAIMELVMAAEAAKENISTLVLRDHAESMGMTELEVYEKMELDYMVMRGSVEEGLKKNLKSFFYDLYHLCHFYDLKKLIL